MIKLESVIDMKLSIDSYIFQRNNDETLDNSSEWHDLSLIFRWALS